MCNLFGSTKRYVVNFAYKFNFTKNHDFYFFSSWLNNKRILLMFQNVEIIWFNFKKIISF